MLRCAFFLSFAQRENLLHLYSFESIYVIKMAASPSALASLSTELLLQIFSYLDPVHSTCLGLSCRRLYHIHFSKHKTVHLDAFTYECPIPNSDLLTMCYLFSHLDDWSPANLVHCWRCHKFCKSDSITQTGPLFGKCNACMRHDRDHSRSSFWQFSVQTRQLGPPPPPPHE